MDRLELIQLGFVITKLAFVFAFGACVGSLVNVLVYRLPLGLGVVTPPSRCPKCETRLTWRENIPIFGWIFLRGKCRFCRSPISAEYPLVEAFTAGLFALTYALFYEIPRKSFWLGVDWGMFAPDWTRAGLPLTWPVLVAILILLGCLVAITLVDAKTFTIPLVLAWVPAIVGLVAHVGLAVYLPLRYTEMPTLENLLPGSLLRWGGWTMATPGPHGWLWVGAALGGMVGLALSNVLLWKGLIRRSYADYEAWEAQAKAEAQAEKAEAEKAAQAEASAPGNETPKAQPADESPADYWIQYPYARREAGKELVFLAPVAALGAAGAALAVKLAGPMTWDAERMQMVAAHTVPLWLNVLAGVLLGYLIGGGVVWLVRIAGTLAFNKDAMGLGDVHIMAAVGAVMGWLDATLAFFLAAFVGLAVEIVSRLAAGKSGLRRAIPYGPSLAIASVLVLLFKPLIELGLTKLSGASAPINLP